MLSHVYTYIYMHVYTIGHRPYTVYIHVCIHVCIYVYVYIYMYIYIISTCDVDISSDDVTFGHVKMTK